MPKASLLFILAFSISYFVTHVAPQKADYESYDPTTAAEVMNIGELEAHYKAQAGEIMDLAPEFRQRNRGGSCVHCSTVMALRWNGLHELADWWWATYRGGESSGPHKSKMEQAGLKFVMTTDADERIFDWALSTRRVVGVTWGGAHCVLVVGKVDGQAVILDNNAIERFKFEPWDVFMKNHRRCGGWAFVIVSGTVPPPVPTG